MNASKTDVPATVQPPANAPRRDRKVLFIMALAGLLLVMMVLASGIGALAIPAREVVNVVLEVFGLAEYTGPMSYKGVLLSIRLPRVVTAVILGISLALAGSGLQAVFRNPLADPGLVGVSSGAALGAGLAIVFGTSVVNIGSITLALDVFTSILAFVLGTLATLLAMRLARRDGRTDVATLLLAGVAVNAVAGGGMGWLTFIADDARLRALTAWLLGSVGGATWNAALVIAVCAIPILILTFRNRRAYDALQLGEAQAWSLGVNVSRLQTMTIMASALAVAGTVSFCGIVGFVGLVGPHLARLIVGARHDRMLPTAALLGGLLVLGADTVARTAVAPAELPLGVLLSMVGGPALVWLLHRSRIGRSA